MPNPASLLRRAAFGGVIELLRNSVALSSRIVRYETGVTRTRTRIRSPGWLRIRVAYTVPLYW